MKLINVTDLCFDYITVTDEICIHDVEYINADLIENICSEDVSLEDDEAHYTVKIFAGQRVYISKGYTKDGKYKYLSDFTDLEDMLKILHTRITN